MYKNKKESRFSLIDRASGKVYLFDADCDSRTLIARVCDGSVGRLDYVGSRYGRELYILRMEEKPMLDGTQEEFQDWSSGVTIPKKR